MASDAGVLLWCLRGHGRDVRCTRRRTAAGLELRVLWGEELFLTEIFRDPQRLQQRSEEFRATLQARGWRPMEAADAASSGGTALAADTGQAGGGAPAAPAPPPDTPLPCTREGRQRAVLVVDDEPAVRSFLRRYLDQAGYNVSEAEDVDTALHALDRQPVDAVVLDVRLPDPMGWGRTGLEVLAFIRLHTAFSGLPVLILTGYSLAPEEEDLIARHRAHLFHKPDGYRMLLERLNQLTAGGAAAQ